MSLPAENPPPEIRDPWIDKFLAHLATDRGASVFTQRNYRQALLEFARWHLAERQTVAVWGKLQRDDFRGYLRYLGRNHLHTILFSEFIVFPDVGKCYIGLAFQFSAQFF